MVWKIILRTATNPSFFNGRLDDNNRRDDRDDPLRVFAPLRLRVKSRTRKTRGRERRERTEIAVYAVCPSINVTYVFSNHKITQISTRFLCESRKISWFFASTKHIQRNYLGRLFGLPIAIMLSGKKNNRRLALRFTESYRPFASLSTLSG